MYFQDDEKNYINVLISLDVQPASRGQTSCWLVSSQQNATRMPGSHPVKSAEAHSPMPTLCLLFSFVPFL